MIHVMEDRITQACIYSFAAVCRRSKGCSRSRPYQTAPTVTQKKDQFDNGAAVA